MRTDKPIYAVFMPPMLHVKLGFVKRLMEQLHDLVSLELQNWRLAKGIRSPRRRDGFTFTGGECNVLLDSIRSFGEQLRDAMELASQQDLEMRQPFRENPIFRNFRAAAAICDAGEAFGHVLTALCKTRLACDWQQRIDKLRELMQVADRLWLVLHHRSANGMGWKTPKCSVIFDIIPLWIKFFNNRSLACVLEQGPESLHSKFGQLLLDFTVSRQTKHDSTRREEISDRPAPARVPIARVQPPAHTERTRPVRTRARARSAVSVQEANRTPAALVESGGRPAKRRKTKPAAFGHAPVIELPSNLRPEAIKKRDRLCRLRAVIRWNTNTIPMTDLCNERVAEFLRKRNQHREEELEREDQRQREDAQQTMSGSKRAGNGSGVRRSRRQNSKKMRSVEGNDYQASI